jgi:hypothetical protein
MRWLGVFLLGAVYSVESAVALSGAEGAGTYSALEPLARSASASSPTKTAASMDAKDDQDSDPATDAEDDTPDAEAAAPDSALTLKGIALEKAGKPAEAVGVYRKALEEDSDQSDAELGLGRCLWVLGWKSQALDQLKAYTDEDGVDADLKAQVQSSLDRAAKARAALGLDLPEPGPTWADWRVDLEASYGWSLNQAEYGHRFNREGDANPFTYDLNPGQGATGGLELSYRIAPELAVGLSFLPLWIAGSGTSANTATVADPKTGQSVEVTTEDQTSVHQFSLPVLLNVHTGARLGSRFKLGCFAGAGAILAQPCVENSVSSYTDSSGTYTETTRYQRDMNSDLVFRGGAGLEWLLSAHGTLFVHASFLVAHETAEGASYSSTLTNGQGKVVGSSTATVVYSDSPPATQAVDAPTIPDKSTANSSQTFSYDDGPTQWNETVHYGSAGYLQPQQTQFSETEILSDTADGLTYRVLSLDAGLRWEF